MMTRKELKALQAALKAARVRGYQIACRSGYSCSTVSNVLNDPKLSSTPGGLNILAAAKNMLVYADSKGIMAALPNGYEIDDLFAPFEPKHYVAAIDEFEARTNKVEDATTR